LLPARASGTCGLLLVLLWAAPLSANPSQHPEEALAQGRNAYDRGDYAHAIQTVHPLLYPSIELGNEEEVLLAHRLLALSYFFVNRPSDAEAEATSILALRPNYVLDPIVDPPTAVSFFEGVRQRQSERLKALKERQEKEAEHARKEEERRRAETHAKAERVFIERVVEHHSRLIGFIPFGVGQAQNGQPRKAIAFATSELLFAGISLGAFLAIDLRYPISDASTLHRTFPAGDQQTATTLTALQLSFGAAFWATVVWGIIDAQVLFQPTVVHDAREVAPPKAAKLSLLPLVSPSAVGLGLSGAF
jgi:hypothetical protein